MQPFLSRRQRLMADLAPGVFIIPTAPEQTRNADSSFPYRYDSSFYYLTGFEEPEALYAQVIGDAPKAVLFARPKDETREIWDGYRYGPAAAQEKFAFDAAYSVEELDAQMVELLANQPRVYFAFGLNAGWDTRMTGWINAVRAQARNGVAAPTEVVDISARINEMRLFKDEYEIAIMRRAGKINTAAHARAMQFARPEQFEYEVEAEIMHEYYRSGSRFPAYSSIVASGPNACILHYGENNRRMQHGELLLIDAGCEIEGYASDITRTFPINGKFSGPQKAIYELVLAAHAAALAEAVPGRSYDAMHQASVHVLTQGLIDLDLIEGPFDEAIETLTYRQFYMHKTGHWLGLDVHDVGSYKQNGDWRVLEPGMAFTIEPGLYIRPAANVPAHFEQIGVRIEDNIVITATGHEVITADCPTTVAEIEALMQR